MLQTVGLVIFLVDKKKSYDTLCEEVNMILESPTKVVVYYYYGICGQALTYLRM